MTPQEQIKKYDQMVDKRGGAPFHVYIFSLYTQSPFDYNNKIDQCKKRAAGKATEFLSACNDVNSAQYSRLRAEFKNNSVLVKKFFFRKEIQFADQRVLEYEDKAYEARLFRGLKVVTPADQEVAYLYEDLVRAKIRAVGYSGVQDGESDYDTVTEFWKTHSLSEDPLPGIMKTPELLKKSIY